MMCPDLDRIRPQFEVWWWCGITDFFDLDRCEDYLGTAKMRLREIGPGCIFDRALGKVIATNKKMDALLACAPTTEENKS